MTYGIILALLALSALFSGLTLGLMGLDVHTLKRKARLGNLDAARVYPIRKNGNQLLITLIIGNVAVNASLSVFLGSLASGFTAGITATVLIVVFGEIAPQALFARHALTLGARCAPLVSMLMRLMYPITHPLGRLLDHLFGEEVPTLYTKRELMEIVSEHEDSEESPIDSDEERIVHGALQFSHKTVGDCMTPRARVVSLAGSGVLDHTLRRHLAEEGYSRYPVVEHAPKRVVGVLYVKDVLVAPTTALVREVCEPHVLRVRPEQTLDVVLARMLKRRLHLAVVYTNVQPLLGVITLEDILEEVIQQEILDEDDT